jgi:hypothetical protein
VPAASAAAAPYFFTAIAFLAGFSERWAQDTIVRSTPLATSTSGPPTWSTSTPRSSAPTGTAAGGVTGVGLVRTTDLPSIAPDEADLARRPPG